MLIKQYSINLPAEYDMSAIRRRIAERSAPFDDLQGLGAKVFLIRERGVCGAQGNQYAPAYLWPEIEPMWNFVAGDLFGAVVDAFGWTPISSWLGLAFSRRRDVAFSTVKSVSREFARIKPETSLAALRRSEIANTREMVATTDHLVARVVGVNMENWSLVCFCYWSCEQRELPAGSWSYEAVHVSAPGVARLVET